MQNGRKTTPHLLFGMDMSTKTVASFCTLDLGGAWAGRPTDRPRGECHCHAGMQGSVIERRTECDTLF